MTAGIDRFELILPYARCLVLTCVCQPNPDTLAGCEVFQVLVATGSNYP
jgi:hypothetical protein